MKEREYIFDSIDLLYYKLHKISLNRGGSYIDSPKRLKDKKSSINPKKHNDKYFQYSITAALNREQINSQPERISNIKYFNNQYNWKEINFTSHKNDSKKSETNNKTMALHILDVPYNGKEIRPA